MSANFPDDARNKEAWPSELGKRRPKSVVKQGPEPTLVQYLGWLDSLEDRDEASAGNTSTKRYWQKFCEQTQNKKMVASWMGFARDVRTADGLLKFRPAFGYIEFGTAPGGRLHPLISFPSAGEFKDKTNSGLGRKDDGDDDHDDHDDDDGSKGNEAVVKSLAAAGSKRTDAAPTKRARQDAQDEGDDDSGDVTRHWAKKPREQKPGRPTSSSACPAPAQPKIIQFTEQAPQLKQWVEEATGPLLLHDPTLTRQFEPNEGDRTQEGNDTSFDGVKEVKREYSP